jgi:hypothetical protein
MGRKLKQSITLILMIGVFLLNVKVLSGSHSSNYLKLNTLQKLWAYEYSGSSSGSSSGVVSGNNSGSQVCWTSSEVPCPPNTTTTTTTTEGPGVNTTSGTTTTTIRYSTSCTSKGSESCQEKNCDRQTVGPVKKCEK